MSLEPTESYGPDAYRASDIPPLPIPEKGKRERVGDELQPWGDYSQINPLEKLITDVENVQECEAGDVDFYKSEWWGWTHQRLCFLNDKLGLKILILAIPFTWMLLLWLGGPLAIGYVFLEIVIDILPVTLSVILMLISWTIWAFFSIYIMRPTNDWIMGTGIAFLLKPFEKTLQKKADATLLDGMSEFNRVTGVVKFALGKGRYFEAPFVEFDAYVERVVQRGGIFYRLMFVHRYTGKTFNKTWLSGVEASKGEILALWDMLQRFMDVAQPIPDMPRFEPFRQLDPTTAEHDRKTDRPSRYWRDLDLETWKQNEENKRKQAQAQYPWSRRHCKLTPKLGQIEMAAYRAKRPETAVPI